MIIMQHSRLFAVLGLVVGIAAGLIAPSSAAAETEAGVIAKPLVITDTGQSVRDLLFVQDFQLTTPYQYEWSAERPLVTEGLLLVLSVDPEFIKPRQTDVPVLFVGSLPAEVVNFGYQSGNVIALIPGTVDLATTPIFFGSYELPERIDAERGAAELSLARAMGIAPFSQARINKAAEAGGRPIHCEVRTELVNVLGKLMEQYSPEEVDRARQYQGLTN